MARHRLGKGSGAHRAFLIQDCLLTMNILNALCLAALGWFMEMLPKAFPSHFPSSGGDGSNGRAVWLAFMGSVEMTLGLGYLFRTQVLPGAVRILASYRRTPVGGILSRLT